MDSAASKLETVAQAAGEMGKEGPPTSEDAGLGQDNNADSPLLELPGELRNRIYEAVFEDHIVRVAVIDGRQKRSKPQIVDHPLLLVCRQVRAEARGLFFSLSTFRLETRMGAMPCLDRLRPPFIGLITKIDIDDTPFLKRHEEKHKRILSPRALIDIADDAQFELFWFRDCVGRRLRISSTVRVRGAFLLPSGSFTFSEDPYLACCDALKSSNCKNRMPARNS